MVLLLFAVVGAAAYFVLRTSEEPSLTLADQSRAPVSGSPTAVLPTSPPSATHAAKAPVAQKLEIGRRFELGGATVEIVDAVLSGRTPVFKVPAREDAAFAVLMLRIVELPAGAALDTGRMLLLTPGGLKHKAVDGFQLWPALVEEHAKNRMRDGAPTGIVGSGRPFEGQRTKLDREGDVANGMVMKAGGSLAFVEAVSVGYEGPLRWAATSDWEGASGVFFEIPLRVRLAECQLLYE